MTTLPHTQSKSRDFSIPIDWSAIKAVATAYIGSRLLLLLILLLSTTLLPTRVAPSLSYLPTQNILIDALMRYDSWWYISLINDGYNIAGWDGGQQSNVAFFPLYPLLVKSLAHITGNVATAGILLSNLTFLIALSYLYALVKTETNAETASRTIFYLAIAPTALFFSAFYTESLYLALVVACFYHARQSNWILAGVLGALAAATRNLGVVLAGVIILEGLLQAGISYRLSSWFPALKKSGYAWAGGLFVPVGLLAFTAFLTELGGDPLLFIRVQERFGRTVPTGINGLLALPRNTIEALSVGNLWHGQFNATLVVDLGMTLFFLALVIIVVLKARPTYSLFTTLSFFAPLLTGVVISMSRYTLMLFPCFVVLAILGKNRHLDRLITILFIGTFTYTTILFSHWYFAG